MPNPVADPRLSRLYGSFHPNVPHGSPLDPMQDPQALRLASLQGTFAPQPPQAPERQPMDEQPPYAVQSAQTPPALPQGPTASIDRKSYHPFDKANRSSTLLAIGTGLLSHPESFSAGIGAAGENVGQLRKGYADLQRKTVSVGGPDDAFEITVDPQTGQRIYTPIAPVQGYLKEKAAAARAPKAPNADENVRMRGATMSAILKLPPAQQAQAYADFRADSARLGYDLGLPPEWNPDVATAMAGQTITPTDRMKDDRATATRAQSATNADRNYGLAQQRQGLAVQRQGLAERKYAAPPSTRKRPPAQQQLPSGAVLVN